MPRQNKVLLAGVLIVILLALVPPWQRNGHPAGYRPIFIPPEGAAHIDLARLMIPGVAVVLATVAGVYLTRNNQNPRTSTALQHDQITTLAVPIEKQTPLLRSETEVSATRPTNSEPISTSINPSDRENSTHETRAKVTFGSERMWGQVSALVVLLTFSALVVWGASKKPPARELKPCDVLSSPDFIPGLFNFKSLVVSQLDVTLISRSDEKGELHGTVHNDSGQQIGMLKLSIKTAKWEREFNVKVTATVRTTAKFTVFIGEPSLDVQRFMVLEGV
jgi:hypothetical protein